MSRTISFIVEAILQNSNASKERIGQRLACYFGLDPGPRGGYDGIDGVVVKNDLKIHFQSKLRSVKLDRDDARCYFSDIMYHDVNISIMLSGVGYKDTFIERLFGHKDIKNVDIHLLELKDIFEKNEKFIRTCSVLPELQYLDNEIKQAIG